MHGNKTYRHLKPGDWICSCGEKNWAIRTECYFCENPKPGIVRDFCPEFSGPISQPTSSKPIPFCDVPNRLPPYPKTFHNVKPVDWICPSCGEKNYPHRQECFFCRNLKPYGKKEGDFSRNQFLASSIPSTTKIKPGEWFCPSCGEKNYAKRQHCFFCQYPRHARGLSSPLPPLSSFSSQDPFFQKVKQYHNFKPGEWLCQNCGEKVFARWESCLFCKTPKNANAKIPVLRNSEKFWSKITDWYCVGCGEKNFGNPDNCLRCRKPRPSDVPSNAAALIGLVGVHLLW